MEKVEIIPVLSVLRISKVRIKTLGHKSDQKENTLMDFIIMK